MIQANNYLRENEISDIGRNFVILSDDLKKNLFLKGDTSSIKDFQGIKDLFEDIYTINDYFEEVYSELNVHHKIFEKYVKNSVLWFDCPEVSNLKNNLKSKRIELGKHEDKISQLYHQNLIYLKRMQNYFSTLNEEHFKKSLTEDFSKLFSTLDKHIEKQTEVINKLSVFQLLPVDQVLQFPDFINTFYSASDDFYKLIQFVEISETGGLKPEITNKLKVYEENMSKKYKQFFEVSQKTFGKYLVNISDKKNEVKKRFLDPVKSKMPVKSFEMMYKFSDLLF
jgi:adenylate kinase family enzyme